ncbi:MAG TPA: hypothetical protein VI386_19810 [Candidatus Sulfotelmatobacter sp.]
MRIRRTLPIVLGVVVVAAAVTVAVQLRKHAPPEPARLLPSADAFFYANLAWARKANAGDALPAVSHDPEYERFIQATGFQFERDLDAAAFAIHYPEKWPGGGTGGAAPEPRFSEVFRGKFDGERLTAYLKQAAKSVETYNSIEIYTIPMQDRSFRVALLGVDTVASSNHDNPGVIQGMVDRSRRLASPFGGPAMLRKYYKRVQLASPVWMVARIQPEAPVFEGWSGVFPSAAEVVLSASYNPLHLPLRTGAIHVRAEAMTGSADDARVIAEKVQIFMAMFHGAQTSVGTQGTDPDVKGFFDSLKVKQDAERTTISATVSAGFLKKLLAGTVDQIPGARPSAAERLPGSH